MLWLVAIALAAPVRVTGGAPAQVTIRMSFHWTATLTVSVQRDRVIADASGAVRPAEVVTEDDGVVTIVPE